MPRRVFAAIGLLGLLCAPSGSALGTSIFRGYYEYCGLPIAMQTEPEGARAAFDEFGSQVLVLDPQLAENWTIHNVFTVAHASAHHALGHLDPAREASLGCEDRTLEQESEADDWATHMLLAMGHREAFGRTLESEVEIERLARAPFPSGEARLQSLRATLVAIDPTDDADFDCHPVTRDCDHLAHPDGDRVECTHYELAHPEGHVVDCTHYCPNRYGSGTAPCHPEGDLVPCEHYRQMHASDPVPCPHRLHPKGHPHLDCR